MTKEELKNKIEKIKKENPKIKSYELPEKILNIVEEFNLVDCDYICLAKKNPETLEEYKETLEHYKHHSCMGGCSHGC